MSDRDPTVLRQVLERKTLRAVITAIGKLAREAAGHPTFERDLHVAACAALARLAPPLLGPTTEPEEMVDPVHPAYRHEAEKLLLEMEAARKKALAEKRQRKLLEQSHQDESSEPLTEGGDHE